MKAMKSKTSNSSLALCQNTFLRCKNAKAYFFTVSIVNAVKLFFSPGRLCLCAAVFLPFFSLLHRQKRFIDGTTQFMWYKHILLLLFFSFGDWFVVAPPTLTVCQWCCINAFSCVRTILLFFFYLLFTWHV